MRAREGAGRPQGPARDAGRTAVVEDERCLRGPLPSGTAAAAARSSRAAEADRFCSTGEAEEGRRCGTRAAEGTGCLAAAAPGWVGGGRSGRGEAAVGAESDPSQVLEAAAPVGCEEEEGELQLW